MAYEGVELESSPIELTKEEALTLSRFNPEDPDSEESKKAKEIMEGKGIEFDSGNIVVDVDGEQYQYSTDSNDFFTGTKIEAE